VGGADERTVEGTQQALHGLGRRLGFGFLQQSVATPHAARGQARSPCRHFNIQCCSFLGSAFELTAFQTPGLGLGTHL
jgi:hypothetical protein